MSGPHRFFSCGGRAGASWLPKNDPTTVSRKQRELIGFPPDVTWDEYFRSLSLWKWFNFWGEQ